MVEKIKLYLAKHKRAIVIILSAFVLLLTADYFIAHRRVRNTVSYKTVVCTYNFSRETYRWCYMETMYVARTVRDWMFGGNCGGHTEYINCGKIIYNGRYVRDFNDKQPTHVAAKDKMMEKHKLPNRPLVDKRSDVVNFATKHGFVKIKSNSTYKIQTLTHSHPYLLPKAKQLLDDIARDFQAELVKNGVNTSYNRLVVTSVFRTKEDVKNLAKCNPNVSKNSVHMYGTTFDISYVKFADSYGKNVNGRCQKKALAVVLKKYKNAGRCCVVYEKLQPCFHITVTP